MRTEVAPVAHEFKQTGARHPDTVARLGVDTFSFIAGWLELFASELEREKN